MKAIISDDFIYLPIAFDLFCDDINSISEYRRDTTEISLQRMLMEEKVREISKFVEENENKFFILDIDRIEIVADRVLRRYLSSKRKIIIINSNDSKALRNRIKEDLSDYFQIEEDYACSDKSAYEFYVKNKELIRNIYKTVEINIIKEYMDVVTEKDLNTLEPMDSSNIYSNMYINTAKLFLNPLKFKFIIYRLLCLIDKEHPDRSDIDAFISASRTGANIANIVGWLLGKKVIFCTNLGPKYSVSMQYLVSDIREKKRYVYLYDFMCIGTEAKLLNSILMIKGSELCEGFGIAAYIKSDSGLFSRMNCLVNVKDEGFEYAVAGDRESLKLGKEIHITDDYNISEI